ncbi:hypothetical protein [Companilactobacillus metriopterae]|uniref:hypothetical protein n=1 Tax=Companilactobacillus metriopterae TaxID=1909267 RepID=UPI00100A9FA0|nr:hypothetical protein [Companilactobacillus metriopterae]
MRAIDLLILLNDFNKNNFICIENDDTFLNVVDIKVTDEGVFLVHSTKITALKNWEFSLLINKKELLELPIFYSYQKNDYQLFGFRVSDNRILLG